MKPKKSGKSAAMKIWFRTFLAIAICEGIFVLGFIVYTSPFTWEAIWGIGIVTGCSVMLALFNHAQYEWRWDIGELVLACAIVCAGCLVEMAFALFIAEAPGRNPGLSILTILGVTGFVVLCEAFVMAFGTRIKRLIEDYLYACKECRKLRQ